MLNAILIAALSPLLQSADQSPALAAPPPSQALIFKSGQAWLERRLPLAQDAVSVRLLLPAAIHGTIWLGSPSHELLSASASKIDDQVQVPVTDLFGALRAAVGSSVELEVSAGEGVDRREGRLLRLLESPQVLVAGEQARPAAPTAVVLSGPRGPEVLQVSRIIGLALRAGDQASASYRAPVQRPGLDVRLKPGRDRSAPAELQLSAMANGLAWAPSYVLELGSETRGRLAGKAVVVNDLEDLVETNVRLVIGYVNLEFAPVNSPLLPEVSIDQFRAMLSYNGNDNRQVRGANMLMNQATLGVSFNPSGPGQPLEGEASEDLFLYDVGPVSLRRGERMYLPLLQEEVEFAHRFDWDLPDRVDNARFVRENGGEAVPVWHVVTLGNDTGAPWTTAPVLVTSDRGPVAQSTLNYTPAGADVRVRLTQALGLVGSSLEVRSDADRSDRETIRLFGDNYEQVRVKGTLELAHRGNRVAPMRVVKRVSGDLIRAEGTPKIEAQALGLGQVNAARSLTWEFELQPGATWRAEYEYQVLIRR
ncbi:MAG TPA: hypothetical protein VGC54_00260 [Planctomycetota bacterium]